MQRRRVCPRLLAQGLVAVVEGYRDHHLPDDLGRDGHHGHVRALAQEARCGNRPHSLAAHQRVEGRRHRSSKGAVPGGRRAPLGGRGGLDQRRAGGAVLGAGHGHVEQRAKHHPQRAGDVRERGEVAAAEDRLEFHAAVVQRHGQRLAGAAHNVLVPGAEPAAGAAGSSVVAHF